MYYSVVESPIGPLLRDRNVLLLTLCGFGAFWGTWGFAFWANALMIRGHHLTAVEAGLIMTIAGTAAKAMVAFDRRGDNADAAKTVVGIR